jgi:PHP family Zn ribbon phosphoesterase
MIDVVADLHLHSKYSRAVSPQMNLINLSRVGKQKGIDILATGDWTHPLWMNEIREQLVESEEGLFLLKKQKTENAEEDQTRFLLSVEIATIFSQNGKGRRIHNLVFVPSFTTAEKVNKELLKRGQNLASDGRPIVGMSSKNLLELMLEIDDRSLLIPAHVWTPWFGIYGQLSGFNSLDEAFADLSPYVYGIETGLSSDPEMNWRVKELETRSILSFSDAHSLPKMGREATVFQLESLSYENIRQAIMRPSMRHPGVAATTIGYQSIKDSIASSAQQNTLQNDHDNKILYTVEFYPEEGKYHYSGHRKCGVVLTPAQQQKVNGICPVCQRKVTDGVMRRVAELSSEKSRGVHDSNSQKVVLIADPKHMHPPFVKIVPLLEIIAEAIGRPVNSPKVTVLFENLCRDGRTEFSILLRTPLTEIEKILCFLTTRLFAKKITAGIEKVREEQIVIQPGYDGVYGTVKIWPEVQNTIQDTNEVKKDSNQLNFL